MWTLCGAHRLLSCGKRMVGDYSVHRLAPLSSDGPENTTSMTQTHVQTQPAKDVTVPVGRVTRSGNVGFMWGQNNPELPRIWNRCY